MKMWKRPLLSRPESDAFACLSTTQSPSAHLAPGAGLNDVFVASYPFASRDWLRILLADLVVAQAQVPPSLRRSLDVERSVPDADLKRPIAARSFARGGVRLLKTSRCWEPCMKRVILVARHPLPTLVSRYHALIEADRSFSQTSIDLFCKVESSRWIAFMQAYLHALDDRCVEACVMRWEDATEQPASELHRLARFAKLDVSHQVCESTVQRHPYFDRYLAYSRSHSTGDRSIREPQAELKARTYRWIESNATPWYRRLLIHAAPRRHAA